MIRNNDFTTRFTQVFILCFRCIVPLGSLYLLQRYLLPAGSRIQFPWLFDLYLIAEVAFYALVFVPRRHVMQKRLKLPPPPNKIGRQALWQKCLASITDPKHYVTLWMGAERLEDVRRGDVAEWLSWALFNQSQTSERDADEIEGYIRSLEVLLEGWQFPPGRSRNRPMRVSVDEMNIMHRPLMYYISGVGGSDLLSYFWMNYHGYSFYALSSWFMCIPFRPQTILCTKRSPAKHTAYWYRKHTSKRRLPILYIHGIGILHTYLLFFSKLATSLDADISDDGQVGILILDIMPISFRMTHAALSPSDFVDEILSITTLHGWDKFVLVGNSFGTSLALQLLKSPLTSHKVADILMIDPVVFLLHCPDMVHNFLRRSPVLASEWQLWYFASADIGAAHTLARRFSWSENILWKEDFVNDDGRFTWREDDDGNRRKRKWTIILSRNDIIVDALGVGRYLTRNDDVRAVDDTRDTTALRRDVDGFASAASGAPLTMRKDWSYLDDSLKDPDSVRKTIVNHTSLPEKANGHLTSTKGRKGDNLQVLWFEEVNHAEVFDHRQTRKDIIGVIMGYCKAR